MTDMLKFWFAKTLVELGLFLAVLVAFVVIGFLWIYGHYVFDRYTRRKEAKRS